MADSFSEIEYVTPMQLARKLQYTTPDPIWHEIRSGRIKAIERRDGRKLIDAAEALRYMESLAVTSEAASSSARSPGERPHHRRRHRARPTLTVLR